jgi:hypothetical protein
MLALTHLIAAGSLATRVKWLGAQKARSWSIQPAPCLHPLLQNAENVALHDTLGQVRSEFRLLASLAKLPVLVSRIPGSSHALSF